MAEDKVKIEAEEIAEVAEVSEAAEKPSKADSTMKADISGPLGPLPVTAIIM